MWTSDYLTGETICAVCGAPKGNKAQCCKTAPFITFAQFVAEYWGDDFDLADYGNRAIAREFYDDYRHSDCGSLAEYKEQTTSYAW